MGLYGMMRTGVSGMNAQSSKLGTVSDNIANSDTTGYKKSGTEFSSLVLPSTPGNYASGGVSANVNYDIDGQGTLQYTTSDTDLAINGDGFFMVQDPAGMPLLTRAGSFTPDASGNLVNAAGYTLLGYDATQGTPAPTANGYAGLVPINVNQNDAKATPSTAGVLSANLPAGDASIAAPTARDNAAQSSYSHKTSLVAYDNLGNEKLVDIYFTKTGNEQWQATAFDHDDAASGASGFPYAGNPVGQADLTFDPQTGKLTAASAAAMTVTVPDGQPMTLDMSGMTQLAGDFDPSEANVNGSGVSKVSGVSIGEDGSVTAQYQDGSIAPLYRIGLADVPSPDHLGPVSGNAYQVTQESGGVKIGFAGSGSLGDIKSGALEGSNVDIASELTDMISAQRNYTANSKVFKTGSDLLNVLVNLQR